MGDAADLQKILADKNRVFYHFTDTRNLPSIREHGLLSMHELRQQRIIMAPGGNDWSIDADKRSGMDRFVHLCFFEEHPMEYVAKKEGRIKKTRFLRVDSSVLAKDGVLISTEVSNKSGAQWFDSSIFKSFTRAPIGKTPRYSPDCAPHVSVNS